MGKMGILFISSIFLLAIFAGAWASTSPCSDGTEYYQCSQKNPGYACVPDPSTGANALQSVVGIKNFDKCQCAQFPGYMEKDGNCVKMTCTDGANTIENGACSATKPKRCVTGTLIDDSNACGCPLGQQMKADGKGCESRSGCRWGSATTICPPGTECDYIESDPKDDGTCKHMDGCVYGPVKCTDLQTCDSSTNKAGVCVPKPGCPATVTCKTGERCNLATSQCEQIVATPALAPNTSKTSTANSAIGKPQCCPCIPGLGMALLAGFVLFRRKEE